MVRIVSGIALILLFAMTFGISSLTGIESQLAEFSLVALMVLAVLGIIFGNGKPIRA